jgi:NAD(P)-dependent dehydrogenase (short-subunit alcohol dehydrogenase family)
LIALNVDAEGNWRMNVTALFDLTGRKALVTGASRGLGQGIAEALASAGADVAVTARDVANLDETVSRVSSTGRRCVPVALDVRNVEACGSAVADAASALGGLDILVNNAGYEEVHPSLDLDEALWARSSAPRRRHAGWRRQAAARSSICAR